MNSLFDLFKIGIGPSSSHTVGPMLAALEFVHQLRKQTKLEDVKFIAVKLYGSLALTGLGHATDSAVIGGLSGFHPATVSIDEFTNKVDKANSKHIISVAGDSEIHFDPQTSIEFHTKEFLPHHPNGLTFVATSETGDSILEKTFYSIGGGFIVDDDVVDSADEPVELGAESRVPYPFTSAADLLDKCSANNFSIAELVNRNELIWRTQDEVNAGIAEIWAAMKSSIDRGCRDTGVLPGGLNVQRRAPEIYQSLTGRDTNDPMVVNDWVSLFALAVNEENAAGGRVVTAPTNGAAGVIPAVLCYAQRFYSSFPEDGIEVFLKTATAIGLLYKMNASLSAAEMGCQGEVGVACSMAAGGLAAVMGGSNTQIENAAEIGMEHNLGLTCDPIRGLVQVPCIERNTMGALKAINAARLAVLYGDGQHRVSLDGVIETMRQTGVDMQSKYKETSQGGLAVNVTEC